MRFFVSSCWSKEVLRRVPVERRFHPKGGASAQQPKAERASHSAVVRPQAAERSRATTSDPAGQPVYHCAVASLAAALTLQASGTGQFSPTAIEHSPFCGLGMDGFKLGECWFKPTRRGWSQRFLVQDRLRASDVLHRDWGWSAWL
jgi:hypothetical protein